MLPWSNMVSMLLYNHKIKTTFTLLVLLHLPALSVKHANVEFVSRYEFSVRSSCVYQGTLFHLLFSVVKGLWLKLNSFALLLVGCNV